MPFNHHVSTLLARRGIENERLAVFLSPDYDRDVHDPFLFDDMERAVQRIEQARAAHEHIVIYGDYDVDGVSGAVILHDVITRAGGYVSLFFNHRENDGYGLHRHCLDSIAERGATLIITTDCGIANAAEVAYARTLSIDTIITDHHTPPSTDDSMPPAYAIIHPQVHANRYPFKHLSGGGSAFKLAQALCRTYEMSDPSWKNEEKWLLDLVALSTISDCVPLLDENRALLHFGLKIISKTRRLGLQALLARAPSFYQSSLMNVLQFCVIPLLNAASRMEHASRAADVLLAQDKEAAEQAADFLMQINHERQRLTQKTVRAIPGNVLLNKSIVLAASPHWRLGVLGLVANKLVATYHKPVILVRAGTPHVGVARSTQDIHIADTFALLSDLFDRFGGHAGAGGFALKESVDLEAFADALERITPVVRIHSEYEEDSDNNLLEMPLCDLTLDFVSDLSRCEPWGPSNLMPRILLKNCFIDDIRAIGVRRRWMRLRVSQDNAHISARISPRSLRSDIPKEMPVDITCEAGLREWRGMPALGLTVESIKLHTPLQPSLLFAAA